MEAFEIMCLARAQRTFSNFSKMAAEPERKYSKEQLESEEVSKKDILCFLQENASKAVGVFLLSAQVIAQLYYVLIRVERFVII